MKKTFIFLLALIFISCKHKDVAVANDTSSSIDHILVIYLENHSFHNLFAEFPGADNAPSIDYKGQVDARGRLYKTLPQVKEREAKVGDSRFPKDLPNKPFLIDRYVKLSDLVPDPIHEFYTHVAQMNGGLNNKFVAYSGVGALTMGYYDMKKSYLWKLAQEYVLADHFYQSAIGGSFLNHQWLIAARTPLYEKAPAEICTQLDAQNLPKNSTALTTDGYAVNKIQPFLSPFDPHEKDSTHRLPPLTYETIGDRLSKKNLSWVWYAGGWNDILNGKNGGDFQFHHQPFVYFKKYAPGTVERLEHLKDEEDLFAAIKNETLPAVAFFKPVGNETAHPGYSDVSSGDTKVRQVVESLQKTSLWKKTLVIITFDEHGGFWDPKVPKQLDRWGLGSRIPAIFVSPQIKKASVDHTPYETTSILAYIEKRFHLEPLTERDKNANPLTGIW
ncbi:MAG: alkaline phosphatase family protein [Pseudobdellovibrionaceae bacterium]